MTIINHFELRWVDGYGAVSDAPSELAVMIEELADRISRSPDGAVLAVRDIRLPNGDDARIGMLQLDVAVPSEQRPVAFLHAMVMPPGHRLDEGGWRALVTRRYGECPEERIRTIYEELAVTTKDRGRDRLRALEIRAEDLREVLGSRTSSARLKLKRATTAREAEKMAVGRSAPANTANVASGSANASRASSASQPPSPSPPPSPPQQPMPASTPMPASAPVQAPMGSASMGPATGSGSAPAMPGAPIIAAPGAPMKTVMSGYEARPPAEESERRDAPEQGRAAQGGRAMAPQSKGGPDPAPPGMAPTARPSTPPAIASPAAIGTWPGMRLQTPPDASGAQDALAATDEEDAPGAPDAPTTRSPAKPASPIVLASDDVIVAAGAAPAADDFGQSISMAGPSPRGHSLGESAKSLGRAPAMWGLAAIAVPALLVAAVIGLGLHAWQLAAERDRLAEELAKPRSEDPRLQSALDELQRTKQELEAAKRALAEPRPGPPYDATLATCPTSLAEARTRLGSSESRVTNLETTLRSVQTLLAAATQSKADAETRLADERTRLESDRDALKRKTTELGDELSKRDRIEKTLCDELRANRSSKVQQLCRGTK